jgi:Dirigent-like protein
MQGSIDHRATRWGGRPIRLLVAAAALGAITVFVWGSGDTARGADSTEPVEFTLSLKEVSQRIVDNPPKNRGDTPTVGDTVAFNKLLLDKNGKRVGSVQAHGTITSGGKNAAETVEGVMILKGGRLTVQETFRFSDRRHDIAITGGTGSYEGATGSITTGLPGQDDDDLLFRISKA